MATRTINRRIAMGRFTLLQAYVVMLRTFSTKSCTVANHVCASVRSSPEVARALLHDALTKLMLLSGLRVINHTEYLSMTNTMPLSTFVWHKAKCKLIDVVASYAARSTNQKLFRSYMVMGMVMACLPCMRMVSSMVPRAALMELQFT